MSATDQLQLGELRDRLSTSDVELPSFTTAELSIASPSVLADRFVTPEVELADEARRQAATSLTARGFLATGEGGGVDVRGTLALISAARMRPAHYAMVTGATAEDRVHLWRLAGTDVVLHERVAGEVHRFVARSSDRAGAALAALALPDGTVDDLQSVSQDEADAIVPEARERFRVESVLHDGEQPRFGHLTVLTHATGTLVVSADITSDTPAAAVTRATSPAALATLLASWIRQPDAAASSPSTENDR